MEEGQTVEIQETREPLREQGSIRALLELLEQQGMEQEKRDVLCMADYIDSMEMQLGTVLKELGEVKKQLGVMQESKVKLFAVNTIQKAEHQVKTLRFQVGEWKRKFVERAEQAVVDFKEKGKDALACAVKGMHLTQGLQKIQSSLHTVMLSMDQKIDRLGSMAEELHVAKGHLKNAFFGNERKRYRKNHRAKSGTGNNLSNPKGVIPIHAEHPSAGTENRTIATADRKTGRKTRENDIFERYPAGTETGIAPSEAWQRRKTEGGSSIKRKFSERGENYERRNNDYLFCI